MKRCTRSKRERVETSEGGLARQTTRHTKKEKDPQHHHNDMEGPASGAHQMQQRW